MLTTRKRRRNGAAEKLAKCGKRQKIDSNTRIDDAENVTPENRIIFGRETEMASLEKLLREGIFTRRPASVFVTGPPGTGKTLVVKAVLQNMLSQCSVSSIYINCVSENTERDILNAVRDRLGDSKKTFAGAELLAEVQKQLAKMGKHIIIVLDEMDYVRPKDRDFLCTVFQWPKLYRNVAVIGIANTLDMANLPKHKLKCLPELIVFAPYTEMQLQTILTEKLNTGNNINAVELCARKVAAMTGDARKAMQVARRSLSTDLVNESTSCRNVLGTLSSVYDSPLLQTRLPLQQKILLATMLRLAEDNSSANIDKDCLLLAYKQVCERLSLPALEVDEFRSALSLLESQSFVISKPTFYLLLVDRAAARKVIADSSLISQINTVALGNRLLSSV